MKILIVEDTEDSLELLKQVLESAGHQVVCAADGQEAWEELQGQTPDLVVTDLLMPNMDGFILLQKIRAEPAFLNLPVVVYTATYTDEQDERLVLELGADAYLLKPMEPQRLLQELNQVVVKRAAHPPQKPLEEDSHLATEYSRSLAKKLDKKIAELEAAQAVKRNFLAVMCHELRTPLNGVIGACDLLDCQPLNEPSHRLVQIIRSGGFRLLKILSDVIDIAQLEQKRLSLINRNFSLPRSLKSLHELFEPSAVAKQLSLVFETGTCPEWLWGDSLRFSQILSNLLSNAIKFTKKGQVTLSLTPLPSGPEEIKLKIEVEDTGIGIDPPRINNLLTPFAMVDDSTTRSQGGTGVGLSIVKDLVELMQGEIKIQSQPGQGTKVTMLLSFQPGQEEEEPLLRQV